MLNINKFRAIGMMAAMMAREKATESGVEANKVIALSPLLEQWKEGSYSVGDIRTYNNAPYRCVQAHNSTGNSAWNPGEATSLWANYHATSAEFALAYVAPTGAHDAYNEGEYMIWTDEVVYKCLANATVYDPVTLPTAWEIVS